MTYWILLIAAILAAVFSDQIDRITSSGGKLRKVLLVSCAGVIVIINVPLVFGLF